MQATGNGFAMSWHRGEINEPRKRDCTEFRFDAGDAWFKYACILKNGQQYVTDIMVLEKHCNSIEQDDDTTVQRRNYELELSGRFK
jgi:hypothetical protein